MLGIRVLSNAVYGFFVVQVHAHIVPKGIVGKTDVHANNLKATYCISVRLFENRVIVFQSISNQNINICIMKEKTQEYHFSLGLTVICETKRNADFGKQFHFAAPIQSISHILRPAERESPTMSLC